MKFMCLVTAMLSLCVPVHAAKKPDVQILESRARRVEAGKVAVDGSVRITAGKPVKGLVIVFDFLSSEGETLTSQKTRVADGALEPGAESSFHAETMNPPGAVRFRLRAVDGAEQDLRVANAGPFAIE